MGIARPLEPRPKPDWPAVVGTSAGLLGLCLLPPLLGRRLGCARKAPPHPAFRRLQRGYRLDTYCSPRAPVTCVKRERPDRDPPPPDGPGRSGRTPEPEDRLDLAGFDTDAFFGVLLGQTRSVTASLGRAEDELRLLFLELEKETKALRRLWGSRRPDPATAERQAPEEARPGGGGRQPGRTQTARGVSGHTEKSGERSQLEE